MSLALNFLFDSPFFKDVKDAYGKICPADVIHFACTILAFTEVLYFLIKA